MPGDVYAIPASGAGVEHEFGKSQEVDVASRARLNSDTIKQTMMYKSYLTRIGQPIDEAEEEDSDEHSLPNQIFSEISLSVV
jgi:hypothetical protein